MAHDDELVADWLESASLKGGSVFYRKHHRRIHKVINAWDLGEDLNQTHPYMHGRLQSVAGSLNVGHPNGKLHGYLEMPVQDTEGGCHLVKWVYIVMRFYGRLFAAAEKVLPNLEIPPPVVAKRAAFETCLSTLESRFKPLYLSIRAKENRDRGWMLPERHE